MTTVTQLFEKIASFTDYLKERLLLL